MKKKNYVLVNYLSLGSDSLEDEIHGEIFFVYLVTKPCLMLLCIVICSYVFQTVNPLITQTLSWKF